MQIGVDSQRAVDNKRVFIVDCDEVSGLALQFMLADECEAHLLADVDNALRKGRDWPPDLLLLGQGNLAKEGMEALAQLRQQHPALKIVVVCDSTDDSHVRQALAQGANSTLLRPLTLESVRRKVDAQLGRRTPLGLGIAVTVV